MTASTNLAAVTFFTVLKMCRYHVNVVLVNKVATMLHLGKRLYLVWKSLSRNETYQKIQPVLLPNVIVISLLNFSDVNECNDYGTCDQECRNTIGSFTCHCNKDYELQADGKTCQAKGECRYQRSTHLLILSKKATLYLGRNLYNVSSITLRQV